MIKKICLFTAHSPTIGGGSTILRSLIEHLPDLDITWYYTNSKAVQGYENGYLGKNLMGGTVVKDIINTWKLLTLRTTVDLEKLVNLLLEVDCDAYWIVSHNEGLRLAWELKQRQQKRLVHLSVHDDWAGAICARSSRYFLMNSMANKLTILTLKLVTTFDVISYGMQQYYQKIADRKGEISHRYLSPATVNNYIKVDNSNEIKVGHIGSIYDKHLFFKFLNLLKRFSLINGKKIIFYMWGGYQKEEDIPLSLRDNIKLYPTLPEYKVIPKLAQCDFLYTMYPLSTVMNLFSITSMPTKLSSYIQASRPIFGHAPSESSIAEFLNTTKLGVLWDSEDIDVGINILTKVLNLRTNSQQWQTARSNYFGEKNLLSIQKMFLNFD